MKKDHRIGPLFTDLYELTMAAGYFRNHILADATFSLIIRPTPTRNYFVAAGLEEATKELASYHFSDEDLIFLENTGLFAKEFLAYLKDLRFTGQVFAIPEGTIFFANEPILEVTAPIIEAQLIETFLLNTIGSQTMFATKGARCIHAADGRPLIDFSLRRTQGQDAGLSVARSTFITGFAGTSNVLAGQAYGIPISGTMAHAYVSAFKREIDAFYAYADTFPKNSVFLIDTYDTLDGARNAVKVALDMQKKGYHLDGVRLDSGNMLVLSQQVRRILDDAGLFDVKIYASSGFDEFALYDLLARGAKIDAFGVGTKVGVSADAPYLDIVYKLVKYDGRNVRKLSLGKTTLAGEKQVFRKKDRQGLFAGDVIGLRDEVFLGHSPLLVKAMDNGSPLNDLPSLEELQSNFKSNFKALPGQYKSIYEIDTYPVELSQRLTRLQNEMV